MPTLTRMLTPVIALVLLAVGQFALAKPSVEDFFRNPTFRQMSVSPNGQYLAALAPARGAKDRMNLAIIDLNDRASGSRFITGLDRQDIVGYTWVSDDDLVFSVDSDGNESFGLYAVSREDAKLKTLVEPDSGIRAGLPSANLLDVLEEDPKHVLITYDERRVGEPDVYKVNVERGGMAVHTRNPGKAIGYMTDHKGRVRVAMVQDKLTSKVLHRPDEEAEWQTIASFQYNDDNNVTPLAFDYDNKMLFVSTNRGHDTAAIYRFDPTTSEFGELLFHNGAVDPSGLMMSDKRKKVIGVTYFDNRPRYRFFSEVDKAMYDALQAQFPDKVVSVSSRSDDENVNLVTVSSDTFPGAFYLYNIEKGEMNFLAQRSEWLDPQEMSEMRAVSFKSRDGLTINGYLTVPKNSEGKNLPLIVNPHGGPFGVRDFWGFNPEHQFLASRGYAVLQVNFRGSGGYGKRFLEAGYKRWGREMQNDITDGVNWAIEQGIADEDRVCIYGASYGGYATMAGMTFTPDLYQCGVNYVGVTDVPLLFKSMPKRWNLVAETMKTTIGDPDSEREMLEAISPINHVEKIQAPIFIVHGRRDPRVVMEHANKLRKAMEKHDKSYEWLVKNNEGHGFRKQENRIELYTQLEKFLAEHLKS